jgi:hypothetical protein
VLPPRANLVLLAVGLCLRGLAYSAAMFWLGHLWLSPRGHVLGLKIVALVWGWGQLGRVNDLLGRELARVRRHRDAAQVRPAEFESDVVARQALEPGRGHHPDRRPAPVLGRRPVQPARRHPGRRRQRPGDRRQRRRPGLFKPARSPGVLERRRPGRR